MRPKAAGLPEKMERRFEFGKNWTAFLPTVDASRIEEAEASLKAMLGVSSLAGKTFLDIGCGSGLFSLAARRLGAEVYSFDYDEHSVECCRTLKEHYFPLGESWIVERGSVLDMAYMNSLGSFDIVYSWGVLHHTGNMRVALKNAAYKVSIGGVLYIALYNDQGALSKFWSHVKRFYCGGYVGKALVCTIFIPMFFLFSVLSGVLKAGNPFFDFLNYKKKRGMSIYYDWLDWLGGYPFEAARADELVNQFLKEKYILMNIKTTNGWGCNEFVFIRGKLEVTL